MNLFKAGKMEVGCLPEIHPPRTCPEIGTATKTGRGTGPNCRGRTQGTQSKQERTRKINTHKL